MKEEQRLYEQALKIGGGGIFSCGQNVSNVLSGSTNFPGVTPNTFLPGNLYRDAQKNPEEKKK